MSYWEKVGWKLGCFRRNSAVNGQFGPNIGSKLKDVSNKNVHLYINIYIFQGDLKTPGSMRYLLYTEWASVSKCIKYQPLDYIKDYFGVKIGNDTKIFTRIFSF